MNYKMSVRLNEEEIRYAISKFVFESYDSVSFEDDEMELKFEEVEIGGEKKLFLNIHESGEKSAQF